MSVLGSFHPLKQSDCLLKRAVAEHFVILPMNENVYQEYVALVVRATIGPGNYMMLVPALSLAPHIPSVPFALASVPHTASSCASRLA